jgi:hypothetical protein
MSAYNGRCSSAEGIELSVRQKADGTADYVLSRLSGKNGAAIPLYTGTLPTPHGDEAPLHQD